MKNFGNDIVAMEEDHRREVCETVFLQDEIVNIGDSDSNIQKL